MTVINNYQTWIALMQRVNVQQNGQIPPSVFNTWYNDTSQWLFNLYAEQFQKSQILSDFLSPFLVRANVIGVPQAGQAWVLFPKPSDYQFHQNIAIVRQEAEETCFVLKDLPIIDGNGKSKKFTDPDISAMVKNFAGANAIERQISLIDIQRWPNCLNHRTKGPTWDNPKATQFAGGFQVAPKGIQYIVLTYLKTPVKSVFSGTISADDIFVYSSSSSVQLEWSDQVSPIFLAKMMITYGSYVNDASITKIGEEMLAIALR